MPRHPFATLPAALCLLLTVLSWTPPATAQVTLPGTQPGDLQNWPLLKPDNCQTCHADYVAGDDYEPFDTWAGSMMANAARDPLFWAAVDIANQDVPGIGEFCIRCHSPRAWLEGRSSTADGSALQGYPDEANNDFDGVDCHFCHRMYEGEQGEPFTENGQYWVDDGTPSQEPPRYGPYDDAFAPHPTEQSEFNGSSEMCGTCHDLTNPLVELRDASGNSTGLPFPEQLTYTEWANSDFAVEGTSCQDCHMPAASADPAYACDSFTPARPVAPGEPGVMRHDLAGANTFIPEVLKGEYGAALGREVAYDYTLARAREMLQQHSATIALTAPSVAAAGDSASVAVRVTNQTGHKLPTGYPEGRRMWLHLRVTDADGAVVFESGAYDDATATLDHDPQLRIYEARHGQHGQGEGFHLVLNDRIYFDSRIPPRGFVPVPGSEPVGVTYPTQPDGSLAHWDDASYRFAVPASAPGPLLVSATLRYQTASSEYVEFLRDENVSGPDPHDRDYPNAPSRGQKIHDLWTQYGRSAPVGMVDDGATIAVDTPPSPVADLQATSGHDLVELTWSLPPGATGVKLLRRGWGAYPEYDSNGGSSPPTWPEDLDEALAAGWVEVYDGAAGSFVDSSFDAASRDVVSYVAFARDEVGLFAPASEGARLRAPTYRLGDLGEVGDPMAYDGAVDGVGDLPVFSLAYGSAEGAPGWNAQGDIGPATGANPVPHPDDRIDFEDLVVFSLAFGTPGPLARGTAVVAESASEAVRVELGPARRDGERLRVPVVVRPGGAPVRALQVGLADARIRAGAPSVEATPSEHSRFVAIRSNERGASIDLAALGGDEGLRGHVADLWVDVAMPLSTLAEALVDARDDRGGTLASQVHLLDGAGPPSVEATRAVSLSTNVPNPFNPRTRLQLRLQRSGPVDVAVFDFAGRRVRTLLGGSQEAGTHEIVWTGVDAGERPVSSGVYLIRASADGENAVRRVVLVR